jgi:hypothetical protein
MRSIASLAFVTLFLGQAPLFAYEWPVSSTNAQPPNLTSQQNVNATLGEYRDTVVPSCGLGPPCPHFHDGVDIAAPQSTPVYPALSGTVPVGGINPHSVLVQSSANNVLYIHVSSSAALAARLANAVSQGLTGLEVTAGVDVLGPVDSNAHVHFKELDANSANVLNSLRSGGLSPYSDTALPQVTGIQLFDATLEGPALGPIIPSGVTALNIRAQANDVQSQGSSYVGVYQIGYQVFNANTGQLATDNNGNVLDLFNPPNGPRQTYPLIPVGLLDLPGDAYDTTVSHGGSTGESPRFQFFYFANNPINTTTAFNLSNLPVGNYNVCVIAAWSQSHRDQLSLSR